MTNYSHFSNQEVLSKTKRLVAEERKLTVEILHLLREVEKRQIYLEIGYGSLFDFAVKDLGYDEASASRRIAAMRLIKSVPEVEAKLQDGSLGLTVAANAHRFFGAEEKAERPYTPTKKREVIEKLEKKSVRDAEKELLKLSPNPIPKDTQKQVTETHVQ